MKSELWLIAFTSLLSNKARTMLSMLGIVIGVATVIAVVGIGAGAQQKVEEQFKNLSVTSLIVMTNRGTSSSKLDVEDVPYVEENAQFIKNGTGTISGNASVSYKKENGSYSVMGVDEKTFEVSNLQVEYGRLLNVREIEARGRVAIIGQGIVDELWGDTVADETALGETISVNGKRVEVIGILKENGSTGMVAYDDTVYVPYSTAGKVILGPRAKKMLYFNAIDLDSLLIAQEEVTDLLRTAHKLKASAEDDFRVRDAGSMVASASETADTMSFLLTSVATIVLIVSGIGIMNVMFVTVAERTKEIGVLKAIGAKNKDILTQFLLESIILTLIGGMIGILLGQGTIPFLADYGALYSWKGAVLGFCFSVFVGIFFGFYPALKASRLDPVDALRSE